MAATANVEVEKAAEAATQAQVDLAVSVANAEKQDDLEAKIANIVADQVSKAMLAVLQNANLQTQGSVQPQVGPSPNVALQTVNATALKANYLKHYRLDGVMSGKYQAFDMAKMDQGLELHECIIKGAWIHFVNEEFYATTENEVKQVEWMIANNGLRAYEDSGTPMMACPVLGCGKKFGDVQGLSNHLAATHGLADGKVA